VELPVWGRLDAGCSWKEFAAGAGAADVAAAAAAFRPAAVLGVDWHSVGAFDRLAGVLPGQPPFIYLNYRHAALLLPGSAAAGLLLWRW